jgi:coenzyme F420-reducing hydrogenase beta subunit
MTGWQLGVKPADLTGIDFRVKIQGKTAKEKGVIAYSANPDQGEVVPRTIQELYGTNYGWGFFKYNACDFCDDVFSETADVSVGDAWLPKYIDRGTNIIIVRNKKILQLLINGEKAGRLFLEPLDSFNVATSQESGLRHRREGLAYRLYLKQKRGEWTPAKRVSPSNDKISMIYKMIYRMRIALSKKSVEKFIEAKKRNNLTYFRKSMLIYMAVYDLLYILYRLFNRGTKTKTS